MTIQKLSLLCCFLLASCCTTAKEEQKKKDFEDFPIKPDLINYSSPPVIKKIDNDFLVNKDLVTNSVILTDYYKRLENWKKLKGIQQ